MCLHRAMLLLNICWLNQRYLFSRVEEFQNNNLQVYNLRKTYREQLWRLQSFFFRAYCLILFQPRSVSIFAVFTNLNVFYSVFTSVGLWSILCGPVRIIES